jgi:hypothetical protein
MNTSEVTKSRSSAWNTAGTWEDKVLKKDFIKKVIEEELVQNEQAQYEFNGYKITGIRSLTGEGSLIMVRGKRKLGYELRMELLVESVDSESQLEGLVRIWELSDDSDEPESFDVYCTKGENNLREPFMKTIISQ